MEPKAVSMSEVTTNHLVMPNDTNYLGTIFGGKVMEYIDITAGIAAMRHARRVCVTASVDRLDFHVPIEVGQIVILKATVNRAFGTSLEVGVRVERENPLSGDLRHTASAYLTFVALDENGRPIRVPEVLPESDEQRRRYEEAALRRQARRR